VNDKLAKRLDKLTLLIEKAQRNQEELSPKLERLEREQAEIRRQVDEQVRRLASGRGVIPPGWANIVTHDEPALMQ
jgi:predicted  nucleic acid-binding Zn-ribbon protein